MTDFSTVTKGANFWVQSYSSRYVVWLAEQVLRRAGRPFSVLDLCAGKGGKSLGLAKTFEKTPEIKIAAFDTSAAQLSLLRENGRRLGLEKSVEVISEDDVRARSGTWDLVLVDAPCTGSGTWNKHPRAKWSCEEKHLAELTRTQSQLFERAKQLVRPGGSILYSVCSLFAEEGARHSLPGTAVPLDKSYLERLGADFHETPQGILIEPGNGFEGFFVALSRV
jgi:16S rRNA C967 or C1407 C5-methylase (RsmB/RsmF family)